MSTLAVNAINAASGGTVTITGAALTTPALGTPASGTLTNCTGFPVANLSGTTMPSAVVTSSLNAITPSGGTLALTGAQTISGSLSVGGTNNYGVATVSQTVNNGTSNLTNLSGLSGAGLVIHNQDNAGTGNKTSLVLSHSGAPGITSAIVSTKQSGNWQTTLDFYVNNTTGVSVGDVQLAAKFDPDGNFLPGADNAKNSGSGSFRWATIYAGTGTINTSDAREKTEVSKLSSAEINAARALAKEIGSFRFLNGRRTHIGMTVQRASEIMQAWGLDPFKYAFICHDSWPREVVEHPAIEAKPATPAVPAVYETRESRETVILDGNETELVRTYLHEVSPAAAAKEAIEAQPARIEVIREAGDRYGFRHDQLMIFIMAGMVAQ